MIVVEIIIIILLIIYSLNVFFYLFYAIAGLLGKKKAFPYREPQIRFCVMVPAYKGDNVIIHSVTENLKQKYPKQLYDIYVIADSFKPETLEKLKQYDVNVIEVFFENSTKAKSINKAFEVIEEKYDYVVLLDVDNVMEPDFLQKLNNRLVTDVQILQAHRVALNADTSYAVLDGVSEEIANHIFRKGHAAVGFSSALIGSGMAVGFRFFKDTMKDINAVGGFDKELEVQVIRRRIRIHWLEDAYVYDEKVQEAGIYQKQKLRWISAQLFYLRKYFFTIFTTGIFKGNFDYADKVFQQTLIPRVLLIGSLFLITLLVNIFAPQLYGGFWIALFVLTILTLAICTPRKYYTKHTLKAMMTLPQAFLIFFVNLFRLKGANKKFIHTPHGTKKN